MPREFAFMQTAPGRVFVGWGPFEQLPFRRPDRPAFFITDFFLDEARPWRHPESWEEIAFEDFASKFGSPVSVTAPELALMLNAPASAPAFRL